MIGLIAVTGGGRAAAERLAAAWPGQTRTYDGPARQALARAWAQCDGLVCFLAVGATVRLIAPLLNSKWTDPAVVCVDESARRAVAVVGGHAAGANALATRVAEVYGADAVITTATDAVSLPGLDTLGWPTEGAIGTVSRALLDGERVRLESAETWPLPPLPDTVGDTGEYRILITDRLAAGDPRTAVLRPPSLVVGVYLATLEAGYEAGVDEVLRLADGALGEAGLSAASVATLAAVSAHGVPLPGFAAEEKEGMNPADARLDRSSGPGWRGGAGGGRAPVPGRERGGGPDPASRSARPGRRRTRRTRSAHPPRDQRAAPGLGGGRPWGRPGTGGRPAPVRDPGDPRGALGGRGARPGSRLGGPAGSRGRGRLPSRSGPAPAGQDPAGTRRGGHRRGAGPRHRLQLTRANAQSGPVTR